MRSGWQPSVLSQESGAHLVPEEADEPLSKVVCLLEGS